MSAKEAAEVRARTRAAGSGRRPESPESVGGGRPLVADHSSSEEGGERRGRDFENRHLGSSLDDLFPGYLSVSSSSLAESPSRPRHFRQRDEHNSGSVQYPGELESPPPPTTTTITTAGTNTPTTKSIYRSLKGRNGGDGGVEMELWLIFTHYTLQSNPLTPMGLGVTQLLRFAKDCHMLGDNKLTPACIPLIFTEQLNKRRRRLHPAQQPPPQQQQQQQQHHQQQKQKLDYKEFLNCLLAMASRICKIKKGSQLLEETAGIKLCDSQLQQLLMDHVLPLAKRREVPPTFEELLDLEDDEAAATAFSKRRTHTLLGAYRPALAKVFHFYVDGGGGHPQSATLSYQGFMGFMGDAGIISGSMSAIDIGDIYLSTVAPFRSAPEIPIHFNLFLELLVRIAVVRHPEMRHREEAESALMSQLYYSLHTTARLCLGGGRGKVAQRSSSRRGLLLRSLVLIKDARMAEWKEDGVGAGAGVGIGGDHIRAFSSPSLPHLPRLDAELRTKGGRGSGGEILEEEDAETILKRLLDAASSPLPSNESLVEGF